MARRPTRHYGERGGHTPTLTSNQRGEVTKARLEALRQSHSVTFIDGAWSQIRGRIPSRREEWLRMMEAGAVGDKETARSYQTLVLRWLPVEGEEWKDFSYMPSWY